LEEGLKDSDIEGAKWGPYQTFAYSWMELPPNDIRSRLPVEIIREKYPEVRVNHEGKREIEDPASLWFEFTGKSAGRVKCSSTNAESKCQEYAQKYDAMKIAARALIHQKGLS
jgi:hypothetical protein